MTCAVMQRSVSEIRKSSRWSEIARKLYAGSVASYLITNRLAAEEFNAPIGAGGSGRRSTRFYISMSVCSAGRNLRVRDCYIWDRFWREEDTEEIVKLLLARKKVPMVPKWIKDLLDG